MNETDRYERFLKWAALVGDYRIAEGAARFESYEANRKEMETEAMRERAKDD